jgi:hypothetical protein
MAACGTFPAGIILIELNGTPAFGASGIENSTRLPIFHILTRAFHRHSPREIVNEKNFLTTAATALMTMDLREEYSTLRFFSLI